MSFLRSGIETHRLDERLLAVRLLRVNYDEGAVPLLLVDEGQDFEALYAEWCALDDAFCDGRLSERQWRDIKRFLLERGVTVLEPGMVQDLRDFYGQLDYSVD